MKHDLLSSFFTLKPHVQIIVILCLTIICLAVLKNAAPAVSIITALIGSAGYIQAKRNSQVIETVVNRLNATTPPHDKTFDPDSILKAAKNGESKLTNAQENQKGEPK